MHTPHGRVISPKSVLAVFLQLKLCGGSGGPGGVQPLKFSPTNSILPKQWLPARKRRQCDGCAASSVPRTVGVLARGRKVASRVRDACDIGEAQARDQRHVFVPLHQRLAVPANPEVDIVRRDNILEGHVHHEAAPTDAWLDVDPARVGAAAQPRVAVCVETRIRENARRFGCASSATGGRQGARTGDVPDAAAHLGANRESAAPSVGAGDVLDEHVLGRNAQVEPEAVQP